MSSTLIKVKTLQSHTHVKVQAKVQWNNNNNNNNNNNKDKKIYGKLRNQKWGFTNRDKRVPDTLPLLKKLFQIGLIRTHLLHVSIVINFFFFFKSKDLEKMDQIQTTHRQEQRRGCKMPLNWEMPLNFNWLVLELVWYIGIRSGGDCDIFNTGLDSPCWDWIFGF